MTDLLNEFQAQIISAIEKMDLKLAVEIFINIKNEYESTKRLSKMQYLDLIEYSANLACKTENILLIRCILEQSDPIPETILIEIIKEALSNKQDNIVKFLLKEKQFDKIDEWDVLEEAIEKQHTEIVKFLLRDDKTKKRISKQMGQILKYASSRNNFELIDYIFKEIAPLVEMNDRDIINAIFQNVQCEPTIRGYSRVVYLVHPNKFPIFKILIQQASALFSADIYTILSTSIRNQFLPAVELLLNDEQFKIEYQYLFEDTLDTNNIDLIKIVLKSKFFTHNLPNTFITPAIVDDSDIVQLILDDSRWMLRDIPNQLRVLSKTNDSQVSEICALQLKKLGYQAIPLTLDGAELISAVESSLKKGIIPYDSIQGEIIRSKKINTTINEILHQRQVNLSGDESSMDTNLTKMCRNHFDEVLRKDKDLQEAFEKNEGLVGTEKLIKAALLQKISEYYLQNKPIIEQEQNNTAAILACVEEHRDGLVEGDEACCDELRALLAYENESVAAIAWRAYDPKARCVAFPNLLTPPQNDIENTEAVYAPAESSNGEINRLSASQEIRMLAALCFLIVKDLPNGFDIFAQYIAEVRRAHNDSDQTFIDEYGQIQYDYQTDNPSCFPGCLTRIMQIIENTKYALPANPSLQIKEAIRFKLVSDFKKELDSLTTNEEKNDLFDALTGLHHDYNSAALNDLLTFEMLAHPEKAALPSGAEGFTEKHLLLREAFIEKHFGVTENVQLWNVLQILDQNKIKIPAEFKEANLIATDRLNIPTTPISDEAEPHSLGINRQLNFTGSIHNLRSPAQNQNEDVSGITTELLTLFDTLPPTGFTGTIPPSNEEPQRTDQEQIEPGRTHLSIVQNPRRGNRDRNIRQDYNPLTLHSVEARTSDRILLQTIQSFLRNRNHSAPPPEEPNTTLHSTYHLNNTERASPTDRGSIAEHEGTLVVIPRNNSSDPTEESISRFLRIYHRLFDSFPYRRIPTILIDDIISRRAMIPRAHMSSVVIEDEDGNILNNHESTLSPPFTVTWELPSLRHSIANSMNQFQQQMQHIAQTSPDIFGTNNINPETPGEITSSVQEAINAEHRSTILPILLSAYPSPAVNDMHSNSLLTLYIRQAIMDISHNGALASLIPAYYASTGKKFENTKIKEVNPYPVLELDAFIRSNMMGKPLAVATKIGERIYLAHNIKAPLYALIKESLKGHRLHINQFEIDFVEAYYRAFKLAIESQDTPSLQFIPVQLEQLKKESLNPKYIVLAIEEYLNEEYIDEESTLEDIEAQAQGQNQVQSRKTLTRRDVLKNFNSETIMQRLTKAFKHHNELLAGNIEDSPHASIAGRASPVMYSASSSADAGQSLTFSEAAQSGLRTPTKSKDHTEQNFRTPSPKRQ